MNPITEEKGAMNDMPIENIEVNMESDLKVLPEEPKQKKKPIAPKRSSIEKAVDISLSICDKMEVDEVFFLLLYSLGRTNKKQSHFKANSTS